MSIKQLSKEQWLAALRHFNKSQLDIYYYPSYYEAWETTEEAIPTCLLIETQNGFILYPFFKKEITGFNIDQKIYDIYTAYGYGGLLPTNFQMPEKDIFYANKLIDNWCQENNIVSEFIRENYLFKKPGFYYRTCKHIKVRKNVISDVSNGVWDCIKNSRRRSQIRKLQKSELKIHINKDKNLHEFILLYEATMERLNAIESYFFKDTFYYNLFSSLSESVEIVEIRKDNQLIAAAMCFISNNQYVYFLGCSDFDSLQHRPNDLMFASMLERADQLGLKWVAFGGGTSCDEDDSLFRFKSYFGQHIHDTHIGAKVHLRSIYDKVCEEWESSFPNLKDRYGNYLQKYRYQN